MLRPADCDGDDCDYDDRGVWRCLPGCLSLTAESDGDGGGWPAEYLEGWTRRPPRSDRRPARPPMLPTVPQQPTRHTA